MRQLSLLALAILVSALYAGPLAACEKHDHADCAMHDEEHDHADCDHADCKEADHADCDHHAHVGAQETFERLKSLEGTWHGTPEGSGAAEEEAKEVAQVVHEFRVSANGTVVMETMGPDTPYEMINMYHVDGEELVLTHYCAGGNQPIMRLDREKSTADKLVFDFAGGTNLNPETDPHIHAAELHLDEGKLKSAWTSYMNGEEAGGMTFHLARAEE
jgi:hypothetical protein